MIPGQFLLRLNIYTNKALIDNRRITSYYFNFRILFVEHFEKLMNTQECNTSAAGSAMWITVKVVLSAIIKLDIYGSLSRQRFGFYMSAL